MSSREGAGETVSRFNVELRRCEERKWSDPTQWIPEKSAGIQAACLEHFINAQAGGLHLSMMFAAFITLAVSVLDRVVVFWERAPHAGV